MSNPYVQGPPWIDPVNQFYGCLPNPWAPMPNYWDWKVTPVNFIRD